MLVKTTSAIALVLVTASGALASAAPPVVLPDQNVYNPRGARVATLDDTSVRFELNRDWDSGRN